MNRIISFLRSSIFLILFFQTGITLMSQEAGHWETVVMASDTWRYFPGFSEPDPGWAGIEFDDSGWLNGPGGFGYGDDDDNTEISQVTSVYLRINFNIADKSAISMALLNVDFDDGFVAFLNGHEIARENIGIPGEKILFDEFANLTTYEARLPQGLTPAGFIIPPDTIGKYMAQGNNVLAIQVHNCNSTSTDLSSTTYLSVRVTTDSFTYRPVPGWFKDPFNELSHLPVLVIDTRNQVIPDDPKITAKLKVINNGPGVSNNLFQQGTDYDGLIGIEVRGQSSQSFPKKSFSIELRSQEGEDVSASLLGMPENEDWVLYAPYSDKTLLRNALTYYLGSRLGGWQPRFRFCEVYLNYEYSGVYMLIESVKRGPYRVDINKLKPDEISGDDLTGGYIVKTDKTADLSAGEYFTVRPTFHYRNSTDYKFTFVYPAYDELVAMQKSYIQSYLTTLENSLNSASFDNNENGYRKYIDPGSFVNVQIMQELTKNVDGYRYSNYFYKRKDSDGGRLFAGPLWDFDLGYGNEDYTSVSIETNGWLYTNTGPENGNRMHWWMRLMESPEYRNRFVSRWKQLRKGALHTDSVMQYIDKTVKHIGVAADRNFEQWPILGKYVWPNYYIGDNYEDEINYLKSWLTDRLIWIDGNIVNSGKPAETGSVPEILAYPNPVKDIVNLSFYLALVEIYTVEFFDLPGRKLLTVRIMPQSKGYQDTGINISGLNTGYYVIRIIQGDRVVGRAKIMVTR